MSCGRGTIMGIERDRTDLRQVRTRQPGVPRQVLVLAVCTAGIAACTSLPDEVLSDRSLGKRQSAMTNYYPNPYVFPLRVSANGRYLVDSSATSQPFFVAGFSPHTATVDLNTGSGTNYG